MGAIGEVHFKNTGGIIHWTANKSCERQDSYMIGLYATKCMVFCTSSRFIAYQIWPGTCYTRRTYSFVLINHNLVGSCFFYSILKMVICPLAIVVFTQWKNISYIPTFYSIITQLVHQPIGCIDMSLIVADRSGCLMMHNQFHTFGVCIIV